LKGKPVAPVTCRNNITYSYMRNCERYIPPFEGNHNAHNKIVYIAGYKNAARPVSVLSLTHQGQKAKENIFCVQLTVS
jgi:hypothetical protein